MRLSMKHDLPWIDMHFAQLQFFHDTLERVKPARDVLGLVREGLDKAGWILLAVEPDDECFE